MQFSKFRSGVPRTARPPGRFPGLRQLLFAHSLSQAGFVVLNLAMPLLAATSLRATPFQVSLVSASQTVAFLLIGLPVGVWVDRMRKRPTMIVADLVRAAVLTAVPVLWMLDALTVTHVCAVAFVVGLATVFFDVADQSYLPHLVGSKGLVTANSRLVVVDQTAAVAGPGVAGLIVQAITAPLAVVVSAFAYVGSALCVARIEDRRPEAVDRGPREPLGRSVLRGVRYLWDHPVLRWLVACSTTMTFCWSMGYGMLLVLLAQDLGVSAVTIGLLFTAGGVGGLCATMLVRPIVERLGDGRAVVLSVTLTAPCTLLAGLAESGARLAFVVCAQFAFAAGLVVYNVAQVSYRQRTVPTNLLGRVNATVRFFAWGARPLGMLLGGVLAEFHGARSAVWAGAVGTALASLWLLCSPLRGMRVLARPSSDSDSSVTKEVL
ncbi:MFS transporter [Streptomyces sp. CNQ085]|uniref:MFS transporter n=1 Tax=Streptomyces sp. CNQ085 TaxID=2886944 RepID=UPI001F513B4B|nr:MFS transporter [Streptomyces sp. CNQ085]MCI0384119.1 MFS transporter [Streptomyces sp. CNQ085]